MSKEPDPAELAVVAALMETLIHDAVADYNGMWPAASIATHARKAAVEVLNLVEAPPKRDYFTEIHDLHERLRRSEMTTDYWRHCWESVITKLTVCQNGALNKLNPIERNIP